MTVAQGRFVRAVQVLARLGRRLASAVCPDVSVLPPPEGVHAEWDVPIVLRDGIVLRANVFRPADTVTGGARVPVIMSAHPYGKDVIPARSRRGRGVNLQYRVIRQPRPLRLSVWTGWEAPDPGFWVPRGYAVVNVDLRGGGTAGGTSHLFSDEEAADYAELVAWAGTRSWSTGRVGLAGVSYLAISQYKVAALRPPHLAAICPWEGFTDLYRDFARPGGVLENGFTVLWSALTARQARVAGNLRRELRARPTRDPWYAARTPALERIEVPMLVCGSFSDHNLHSRGSFEAFRRAGSTHKWLYTHRDGKWCHFYSAEAGEAQARFFDWALNGTDNGWTSEPPVRLAVHETGSAPVEVRHEQAWPPADLTWTPARLDLATRTLSTGGRLAPCSLGLDTRGDGVTLDWIVPHNLDVIGPMALRLYVESVGCDDVHLFAGVRALRAGVETTFEGSFGFDGDMVTHGWQRAAFRELDPDLSTRWQPVHTFTREERLRPGEVVPVDIALLPQATRFRAGDTLRLGIRGTWPYARNPVTGQFPSGYAASPAGRFVLHTGGDHDTHLLIGTRPVGAGAAARP